MNRMYWIFLAVTILVTIVWWAAPAFVGSDTGYTALGTLFSALAFAGLIATLYAQREAIDAGNKAHEQSMASIEEANLVSSASGLVTALSTALDHVDAELQYVRGQQRETEDAALIDVNGGIEKVSALLKGADVDPVARDFDLKTTLIAMYDRGIELNALRIDLNKKEGEMFNLKSVLLEQMLAASTAVALMYDRQIAKMPENAAKRDFLHDMFQKFYGTDFPPSRA